MVINIGIEETFISGQRVVYSLIKFLDLRTRGINRMVYENVIQQHCGNTWQARFTKNQ